MKKLNLLLLLPLLFSCDTSKMNSGLEEQYMHHFMNEYDARFVKIRSWKVPPENIKLEYYPDSLKNKVYLVSFSFESSKVQNSPRPLKYQGLIGVMNGKTYPIDYMGRILFKHDVMRLPFKVDEDEVKNFIHNKTEEAPIVTLVDWDKWREENLKY